MKIGLSSLSKDYELFDVPRVKRNWDRLFDMKFPVLVESTLCSIISLYRYLSAVSLFSYLQDFWFPLIRRSIDSFCIRFSFSLFFPFWIVVVMDSLEHMDKFSGMEGDFFLLYADTKNMLLELLRLLQSKSTHFNFHSISVHYFPYHIFWRSSWKKMQICHVDVFFFFVSCFGMWISRWWELSLACLKKWKTKIISAVSLFKIVFAIVLSAFRWIVTSVDFTLPNSCWIRTGNPDIAEGDLLSFLRKKREQQKSGSHVRYFRGIFYSHFLFVC